MSFTERKNEDISIRNTNASEAEELSQIQKAAFQPLYEKYHDAGNPYLRGEEDILRRLDKKFRQFTILYKEKIVGAPAIEQVPQGVFIRWMRQSEL